MLRETIKQGEGEMRGFRTVDQVARECLTEKVTYGQRAEGSQRANYFETLKKITLGSGSCKSKALKQEFS